MGQAFLPAAGIPVGLGSLYPPPTLIHRCQPHRCRAGPACPPLAPASSCTSNPQILLSARRFSCRHGSELPARPQPPSPFRCGSLALCFVFSVSSVSSVLLTPEIFPAREDFHVATGASCRRDHSRHACLVAAMPRCGFPSPCPPWFAFSGLLTPDIFPAREDFHAATGARCRRGHNRHRCLVAALPRCGAPLLPSHR